MSALMVYYSMEGNTDYIAKEIASRCGADLVRLIPKKGYATGKASKYVWNGFCITFHMKPKLVNEKIPVDRYDTIIIGTPVWSSDCAPPLLTFFSEYQIKNKNIYFVICHAGGGGTKTMLKMERYLDGNIIKGKVEFRDPLKGMDKEVEQKLKEFCKAITEQKTYNM